MFRALKAELGGSEPSVGFGSSMWLQIGVLGLSVSGL